VRVFPVCSLAFASVLLAGCGFYGWGDEGHAPSASREQINQFLAACGLEAAQIKPGGQNGTTDWIIDFDVAARSDFNCLDEQEEQAGVMVTKLATRVDESS
jgi:hypothetical protein